VFVVVVVWEVLSTTGTCFNNSFFTKWIALSLSVGDVSKCFNEGWSKVAM
jgi:hypothetical protein